MIPPDVGARDAIVGERERNVIVDAGAGTGKTTTIVRRLVAMLAPSDDHEPLDIHRVAAITFTRRAAGELRLRLREALVEALEDADDARRPSLERAREGLETAYIGTIHSFADRLLRLFPVETRLSPSYEIAEEPDVLVRETYDRLLRAVESRTLERELEGVLAPDAIALAQAAIEDAIESGVRLETQESDFYTRHGLDSLVASFIEHRDVPANVTSLDLDLPAVHGALTELVELVSTLPIDDSFGRTAHRIADQVSPLRSSHDPRALYRGLIPRLERLERQKPRKKDCAPEVWAATKHLFPDTSKKPVREVSIVEALRAPLQRWLAHRLAQSFDAVVALYEQVKQRHGVVDQVDLMLRLRNALRDQPDLRREYGKLFDHIFVDEFQDTDPLQAEIVFYLCEDPSALPAEQWSDVELLPGKLTIVGDAKQSIYRFRRADVAVYDRVQRRIAPTALHAHLTCNFRSEPALIEWVNEAMQATLQESPDGSPFDARTGQVFHQPLDAGRVASTQAAIHLLPYAAQDKRAEANRKLEGAVLARYLRSLVETEHPIIDPDSGEARPVRFGDMAVLCLATSQLRFLLAELDAVQIPHSVSGGRLFMADPLHQQLILGLVALADRDDGVATAALLRPPFFAVDLDDHLQARSKIATPGSERVEASRQLVQWLRRDRFKRTPGATARKLIEETAFGATVALGPNGEQRIARIRELCHVLDELALRSHLDFDGVAATLRTWIDAPPGIDAPRPVGSDALQVMTVHQAKGLEFPVVVLWDGMAQLAGRGSKPPWWVERGGDRWALHLDGVEHAEPPHADIAEDERTYLDHERRRLIYVACTRARDLLVLPKPEAATARHIAGLLTAFESGAQTAERHTADEPAAWFSAVDPSPPPEPTVDEALAQGVEQAWREALTLAQRPQLAPRWASQIRRDVIVEAEEEPPPPKPRRGRHGAGFGTLVHRALELVIGLSLEPEEAVARAAAELDLEPHADARADVERGLAALSRESLMGSEGPTLRTEYPVAAVLDDGQLTLGTIDLVAANDHRLTVIDFKTDTPPAPGEPVSLDYVGQLEVYARLVEATGLRGDRTLRLGLLYTADGTIRWVHPTSAVVASTSPH